MAQALSQKYNSIQTELNQENSQLEIRPSLISLLRGRWEGKYQILYIWAVCFALVGVSAFAQIVFPTRFNWITHTISEMGSIEANPSGHLLWRIVVIINGIAHIPHILYIKNHIGFIHPKLANLFTAIGISSALGFSLVGLIPLDYGPIHYIFALIAFVGYYFAGNITFIILSLKSNPAVKRIRKSKMMKSLLLIFNVSGLACLFSFLFYETPTNQRIYPPAEWLFLISICVWLLLWPRIVSMMYNVQNKE